MFTLSIDNLILICNSLLVVIRAGVVLSLEIYLSLAEALLDAGLNSGTHLGTLITGSWDTSVRFWDHRSNQGIGVYAQPDKVYAMTVCGDYLVVCTASKHFWVWDTRNMAEPFQRREAGLKYQTRCVAAMPSKQGVVMGSIEGRVALEYIHTGEGKKNFAFKCHRQKDGDKEVIYPVNAVAFHPGFGTFATGGSDGTISTWDGNQKKRLYQFQAYETSIASLAFNSSGTKLAIAASYMMEEGVKDHPKDAIHIRTVTERQVKPKS
eukprot:m.26926 g.26926  ORF g.26926 m.26926 type:complete len:265 (+) comp11729_c0_seq1:400-1194(+)